MSNSMTINASVMPYLYKELPAKLEWTMAFAHLLYLKYVLTNHLKLHEDFDCQGG